MLSLNIQLFLLVPRDRILRMGSPILEGAKHGEANLK